jgi:hypothetical protein
VPTCAGPGRGGLLRRPRHQRSTGSAAYCTQPEHV